MKMVSEPLKQPMFASKRSPDVEHASCGVPNHVYTLRVRRGKRLAGCGKTHLRLANESVQKDLDFV